MATDAPAYTFDLEQAIQVLEATPETLRSRLASLPQDWLNYQEDPAAWSPTSVLIHFVHNEKVNWIPRARVILSDVEPRKFVPFQQMPPEEMGSADTAQLLDEFAYLRTANLSVLRGFRLDQAALDRQGEHPALGTVSLRQLLATWVVHDMNHTHQIVKTLAKRYIEAVGPWRKNLTILDL
jgi:hypothetical protein